jgi:hypothetical protein
VQIYQFLAIPVPYPNFNLCVYEKPIYSLSVALCDIRFADFYRNHVCYTPFFCNFFMGWTIPWGQSNDAALYVLGRLLDAACIHAA